MLRTTHTANQLSIYGTVSSWCIDLAEKMHSHAASTGVDRFISKENDQTTTQLDPQEVGSLVRNQPKTEVAGNWWHGHLQRFEMMNSDEQLRTVCEETGFIRTVSRGMYHLCKNNYRFDVVQIYCFRINKNCNDCNFTRR